MIRPFDITNQEHQRVMSSMAALSTTKEWTTVKGYLEKELHILDVNQRMADPLTCSRLGAAAHTLQIILDKIDHSIDMIAGKKVRY